MAIRSTATALEKFGRELGIYSDRHEAATGTCYITFSRGEKNLSCVIRVADHAECYDSHDFTIDPITGGSVSDAKEFILEALQIAPSLLKRLRVRRRREFIRLAVREFRNAYNDLGSLQAFYKWAIYACDSSARITAFKQFEREIQVRP